MFRPQVAVAIAAIALVVPLAACTSSDPGPSAPFNTFSSDEVSTEPNSDGPGMSEGGVDLSDELRSDPSADDPSDGPSYDDPSFDDPESQEPLDEPVADEPLVDDPGEPYGLGGLTEDVVREAILRNFGQRGTEDPANPCQAQIEFGQIRIANEVSLHQVEWGQDARPIIAVQPEYIAHCEYPDPNGQIGFLNDADYIEQVPNNNQRNFYFWRDSFGDWAFVYGG